jgi:hypothetical protein
MGQGIVRVPSVGLERPGAVANEAHGLSAHVSGPCEQKVGCDQFPLLLSRCTILFTYGSPNG